MSSAGIINRMYRRTRFRCIRCRRQYDSDVYTCPEDGYLVTGFRRSFLSWILVLLALGTFALYVLAIVLPKGPFYEEWKALDSPLSPALTLYLMTLAAFFFALFTIELLQGRPHWLASFLLPLLFMATLAGLGIYSNIYLRLVNQMHNSGNLISYPRSFWGWGMACYIYGGLLSVLTGITSMFEAVLASRAFGWRKSRRRLKSEAAA